MDRLSQNDGFPAFSEVWTDCHSLGRQNSNSAEFCDNPSIACVIFSP